MGIRNVDERPESNKENAPEGYLPELRYKSLFQVGKTGKACENVESLGTEWQGEFKGLNGKENSHEIIRAFNCRVAHPWRAGS